MAKSALLGGRGHSDAPPSASVMARRRRKLHEGLFISTPFTLAHRDGRLEGDAELPAVRQSRDTAAQRR